MEKALVLDQRLEAGPSHRTRLQLGDIPFQVLVGRNADGVAYTPLFERLVEHDILQFLTRQVVLNVIRRGLAHVQDRLSFDICQLYEALKERGVSYAIRISANENLERDIAELPPRPVGRPGLKPLVEYKSFPLSGSELEEGPPGGGQSGA